VASGNRRLLGAGLAVRPAVMLLVAGTAGTGQCYARRPRSPARNHPAPRVGGVYHHLAPLEPSNAGRPVIDRDLPHREVVDVCGGDRSTYSERGSRDQAVGLVEGHSSLRELTSPGTGADPLSGAQWRDPQTVEQAPGYWFFDLPQPAPDLLDRDGTHPWLRPDPSEPGHSRRRRPAPERVDQDRGVEQEPGHLSGTPSVPPALCTGPARRILVPIVASVRDPVQCGFDVVPSTLVF
jgi:hypothetical protein